MNTKLLLLGVVVSVWTVNVQAQPPGPRESGPRHNPIIDLMDADGDHEITFDEIASAVAKLKEQDTNGDEKLTGDEMIGILGPPPREGGPRDGRRSQGGARDGGPRDGDRGDRDRYGRGPDGQDRGGSNARRRRGGPAGPPSPEMMVKHAFEFDADGDGLLSKTEMTAFATEMGKHRHERGGHPDRGDRGGRPGRPQRPE